jgi:hypothetical protein
MHHVVELLPCSSTRHIVELLEFDVEGIRSFMFVIGCGIEVRIHGVMISVAMVCIFRFEFRFNGIGVGVRLLLGFVNLEKLVKGRFDATFE